MPSRRSRSKSPKRSKHSKKRSGGKRRKSPVRTIAAIRAYNPRGSRGGVAVFQNGKLVAGAKLYTTQTARKLSGGRRGKAYTAYRAIVEKGGKKYNAAISQELAKMIKDAGHGFGHKSAKRSKKHSSKKSRHSKKRASKKSRHSKKRSSKRHSRKKSLAQKVLQEEVSLMSDISKVAKKKRSRKH